MQSFAICLSLVMLFAVASAQQISGANGVRACKSIKPTTVDFEKLMLWSPFNLYQTNNTIFNCAKVVFTGPGGPEENYTGSSIVIKNDTVFTFQLNLFNNNTFNRLLCPTGFDANYTVIYFNATSKPAAGLCVLLCDANSNGIGYENLICVGKTQIAYQNIQTFLSNNLRNVPGIFNAQDNCPQPTRCNFFLNK